MILPGMVPRLELSKNCLGQFLDSSSEPPSASKKLLLGESSGSSGFLGQSRTFRGEARAFLGETRNFVGEFRKLVESAVIGKALLVGVQGDEGLSKSALFFTLSLMALLFHLLISACWLETKLMEEEDRGQRSEVRVGPDLLGHLYQRNGCIFQALVHLKR